MISKRSVFAICLPIVAFLGSVTAIWPQPYDAVLGTHSATLDLDNLRFKINVKNESRAFVDAATNRTLVLLRERFVPWMLTIPGQPYQHNTTSVATIREIQLTQRNISFPGDQQSREAYELYISIQGEAHIHASFSEGLLHGLNTLTQLCYASEDQKSVYVKSIPVRIRDRPAFVWRGINLDVARHFLPLSKIESIIDTMSWNKLNKLHLHVTDAQSWPLEIPSLPELSKAGAFHQDMVYSAQNYTHLQEYAQARGIELVTEIDLPGHTASIAKSHPELIAGYNVQAKNFSDSSSGHPDIAVTDWSAYCAEPPCGQLKLNRNSEFFLAKLLDDVLPRVKPYSAHFHAGGDEVNKNIYLLQEGLRSNATAVLQPLVSGLVLLVHELVRRQGLKPIAWQEMLLDWKIPLKSDVLVQAWISQEAVKRVVQKGYKVIAGASSSTYLDCGKGQWLDFTANNVAYQQSQGFVDYCSPFKNWKTIYTYDPIANLTAREISLVQGFEVHAWAEQIDKTNIETMLWPRAASAAEVGWNGTISSLAYNSDVKPNSKRSLENAGMRLSEWRERMVHRGIQAEPIHSLWCTQRPGQCAL